MGWGHSAGRGVWGCALGQTFTLLSPPALSDASAHRCYTNLRRAGDVGLRLAPWRVS
jgi:hypothetical protein